MGCIRSASSNRVVSASAKVILSSTFSLSSVLQIFELPGCFSRGFDTATSWDSTASRRQDKVQSSAARCPAVENREKQRREGKGRERDCRGVGGLSSRDQHFLFRQVGLCWTRVKCQSLALSFVWSDC